MSSELIPQRLHNETARDADNIPPETLAGLRDYVIHRIPPGDFLAAVLTNDLMGSIGRADQANLKALPEICRFVHWVLPSGSHGSRERVAAWLKGGTNG